MDRQLMREVGSWSFIIGVIVAVIIGILSGLQQAQLVQWVPTEIWTLVTLSLGLIVGLLNVSEKETIPFLIAVIALGMAGSLGPGFQLLFPYMTQLGAVLTNILVNISAFAVPAGVVVALKSFYNLASTPSI